MPAMQRDKIVDMADGACDVLLRWHWQSLKLEHRHSAACMGVGVLLDTLIFNF